MRVGPLLGALGVMAAALPAARAGAQELQGEDPNDSRDLTESIPPSSGDTLETIVPDNSAAPPPATPEDTAKPEEAGSHVQLSGYARQSLELVYGELARRVSAPTDPATPVPGSSSNLWRDSFTSHTQLALRASYLKNRRFEATISGVLDYTLHVAKEAPLFSTGVVDLMRGELDPQLRDAYVGFWPNVDLRIGQQRVAWGKSDFQSPNDVINARDLRDPFLAETELRYLPTPVARASVSGGPVTFEVVVSPFFVPDRFDMYGSNWAAIQRHSPQKLQEFLGSTSLLVDPTVERGVAQLWRQTERPQDNGKGAAAGARLSANLSGTDISAYYHYGYDSTPLISVSPEFQTYLSETEFTTTDSRGRTSALIGAKKFSPLLQRMDNLAQAGEELFSARYIRRHHVGLDLATTFGPVVMRVDAAYETRRVFYRSTEQDMSSWATPTALGVFGLKYQTGSLDDVVLVELLGARLFHVPDVPLLAYEQTTVAVAGTLRWTLGESWGVDLRGLVGIQPQTYALQPALRFKPSDAFTLRVGALLVSGAKNSFGWYYGDNDTAFVQLRYAF